MNFQLKKHEKAALMVFIKGPTLEILFCFDQNIWFQLLYSVFYKN